MTIYDKAKRLEGVPYIAGWQDCYTTAQVFYKEILSLELPSFSRPKYWDQVPQFNFFETLFQKQGFVDLGDNPSNVSVGDALLFRIGHSVCLNHIAIYVGQNQILHHIQGRNRVVESYSHKWRYRVGKVIRHPDMESLFTEGQILRNKHLPQALKNKLNGIGHG